LAQRARALLESVVVLRLAVALALAELGSEAVLELVAGPQRIARRLIRGGRRYVG
jgi:hypothetical protein